MPEQKILSGQKNEKRVLEKFNGLKLGWLHDSIFFLFLIVVIFCIFRFCIGVAIVGGDSMEPSLRDGDIVVYNRMIAEYKPGDVVSVRVPSGDYYVKRVVAVGGDVVELNDGTLYVNGEPLLDDDGYGETLEESGAVIYPYIVREGNVFVLGDNRAVSMDSRMFGEVNQRQIKGKLILQIGISKDSGLTIRKLTDN